MRSPVGELFEESRVIPGVFSSIEAVAMGACLRCLMISRRHPSLGSQSSCDVGT